MNNTLAPVLLAPSAFDHLYLGGASIASLGGNEPSLCRPEERLGSTVSRWCEPENGLTTRRFGVDGATDGHLNLGFDTALDMVRPDTVSDSDIETLISRPKPASPTDPGLKALMPIAPDGPQPVEWDQGP